MSVRENAFGFLARLPVKLISCNAAKRWRKKGKREEAIAIYGRGADFYISNFRLWTMYFQAKGFVVSLFSRINNTTEYLSLLSACWFS